MQMAMKARIDMAMASTGYGVKCLAAGGDFYINFFSFSCRYRAIRAVELNHSAVTRSGAKPMLQDAVSITRGFA